MRPHDPATAADECNPCVDDPATAADECNPCVDDPATVVDDCTGQGPTSPPAGPPTDPPAVRPLSSVRPTEVLGTTQTRPSSLPATGTDTVGPLFLALGLAFLGAGFVLLSERSTRKLLTSQ